ncbi:MAG: WecB/TagA/CpsF family glycosyltransferase [Candidatus Moranbacteria bacterium]|nr:WecB/TagA/CpsF family glycosyltransferase [Candidatus Moranbacteria bacterium]
METKNGCSVLGVAFDGRSQEELEKVIGTYISGDRFGRITTINPEFLVLAHRDAAFGDVLRAADVRVADGSGVVLAGLLFGCGLSRYPGADLMKFILSKAEREGIDVYVATKKDGLSIYEDVRKALLMEYPDLRLNGEDMDSDSKQVPSGIRDAMVVLCNFGAPEQEYFLESLRRDPGSVRLAVGVGGAFDFVTGKRSRAPRWMRAMGLEWIFRFAIQPSRVGRIWSAVVIFPFLLLSDRISNAYRTERNR